MTLRTPSSEGYDSSLMESPHFQRIPNHLPFVGEEFESPSHGKLLILGESGYFPPDSTIHQDAQSWYQRSQAELSEKEVSYLSWRRIIGGEWEPNGHQMYRSLNQALKEVIVTEDERAFSHVAYCNTYYRPANYGETIKSILQGQDKEVSIETTQHVLDALQPDLVIYATKFGWDSVGWQVAQENPQIRFTFTAHAADNRWWQRKNYEHTKTKFLNALQTHFLQ